MLDPMLDSRMLLQASRADHTPGPIVGLKVGIIAGADSDVADVTSWCSPSSARRDPVGDRTPWGRAQVRTAQRHRGANAADRAIHRVRRARRRRRATPTRDIKLVVLLQEAFRHCKPVAAWDDGTAAPAAAGIDLGAPGVLVAASVGKSFTDALADAVGLHRVWERAVDVMASEVAPVR